MMNINMAAGKQAVKINDHILHVKIPNQGQDYCILLLYKIWYQYLLIIFMIVTELTEFSV